MPGPLTVLVVDDDPVIVRLLEVNFDMEGCNVLVAHDGEEALAMIRDARPDAVVCDIMMPKVSGLEVVEQVRADADEAVANTPVVLLSAKAQSVEVQRGIDAGADDYVTKPFDPLDLVERVNAVVEKRRQ